MRKSALIVASFTAMALALGGCQSSLTGDTYSREEARTVQTSSARSLAACWARLPKKA